MIFLDDTGNNDNNVDLFEEDTVDDNVDDIADAPIGDIVGNIVDDTVAAEYVIDLFDDVEKEGASD